MKIGQRIRTSHQGMTVTSASGTIEREWEIVAIDEDNQMCDCRVVYDNRWMNPNTEKIDKFNFDFVNKNKVINNK